MRFKGPSHGNLGVTNGMPRFVLPAWTKEDGMPREPVEPGVPKRLLEGYKAFHYGRLRHERERYERLAATGQKPEIMVISCCDSRPPRRRSSTQPRGNCLFCEMSQTSCRPMHRMASTTVHPPLSNLPCRNSRCATSSSWVMAVAVACMHFANSSRAMRANPCRRVISSASG